MGNFIDLKDQKFNNLTVISRAENDKFGRTQWNCQCECGNKTIVKHNQLIRKDDKCTKSCGCLKISASNHSKERLYKIWFDMKRRCYNKKNSNFQNYGGRGITVCDEWRNNYLAFKKWSTSNGYSDVLSIDRKDVNGNYEPSNCRWATEEIQRNNKRSSHYVIYNNAQYTITEFSRLLNVSTKTIYNRISEGLDINAIAERYLSKNGRE